PAATPLFPYAPLFRSAAIDDLARHLFRIGEADEHARGTGADLSRADISLHGLRQLEQTQRVADMAAALAHHAGDLVVTVAVLVQIGRAHVSTPVTSGY